PKRRGLAAKNFLLTCERGCLSSASRHRPAAPLFLGPPKRKRCLQNGLERICPSPPRPTAVPTFCLSSRRLPLRTAFPGMMAQVSAGILLRRSTEVSKAVIENTTAEFFRWRPYPRYFVPWVTSYVSRSARHT